MKAGDKVICVDDTGWLIPQWPGPSPKKGSIYCIREVDYVGSVCAISLVGFDPEGFYRASRFRPVQPNEHQPLEQAITA